REKRYVGYVLLLRQNCWKVYASIHTRDKRHARFYHLFCEDGLFSLVNDAGFKGVRGWREGDIGGLLVKNRILF
ncbi:MAG: hypothetical protein KAJ24_04490, partial [Candidatus Aenigmarchaeota archaeon]|nr:hypothetical protein [Candidatus Aenigmarchaeota archaeon]